MISSNTTQSNELTSAESYISFDQIPTFQVLKNKSIQLKKAFQTKRESLYNSHNPKNPAEVPELRKKQQDLYNEYSLAPSIGDITNAELEAAKKMLESTRQINSIKSALKKYMPWKADPQTSSTQERSSNSSGRTTSASTNSTSSIDDVLVKEKNDKPSLLPVN